MAEIRPFHGLRYNTEMFKDLCAVLAPPYDVISPTEQLKLHGKSPFNVVRLILPEDQKHDNIRNNKYTRARQTLEQWLHERALTAENAPAVYVYVQDYREGPRKLRRVGFLAAMRIDEQAVLRHENTLAAPKKDRMALLKEVRTNLSPIFGLFEDESGAVNRLLNAMLKGRPAIDATLDGVRHRVFVETSPELLERLKELMRPKPMFIADGHHRFEVACQFRNWMRSENPSDAESGWNYVMVYLADLRHNPLNIWPTHRLICVPKSLKDPLAELSRRGALRKSPSLKAVLKKLSRTRQAARERGYTFGVYSKKAGFFLFSLDPKLVNKAGKDPVGSLDVSVLHRFLIEPCFGIRQIERSDAIDFTRDAKDACEKVAEGEFDLALFLRPTSLDEMVAASKKGLKMPQKSTYFYPKLLSGLVLHRFEDNRYHV